MIPERGGEIAGGNPADQSELPAGSARLPQTLVEFFRQSPLVGLDLDFERDPDIGRDIDI